MPIKVSQKIYRTEIDSSNPYGYISADLGLAKGDMIVFREAGAPVRFPAPNSSDKTILSDPTSEIGMKWGNVPSSGGGGGGESEVTLTTTFVNNTGVTIVSGMILCLDENGSDREIRKATSSDNTNLFIASEDTETGEDIECYTIPNTICNVLCTEDAVAVGDKICLSDTPGLGETSASNGPVGIALTAKSSGETGYVKVLLNCIDQNNSNPNFTVSTTDLTDGTSELATNTFWYYYEE